MASLLGQMVELYWLDEIDNPDNSDFGFSAFMGNIDALIMGKNTFEKVLSFGMWPYERPVFVASNSLSSLPSSVDGKAFLLKAHPRTPYGTLVKGCHICSLVVLCCNATPVTHRCAWGFAAHYCSGH